MDIKFGTDGWRGVMAREFTFENVRLVAQAIADYAKDETMKNPKNNALARGPFIVGYDRRFQSDAFAREIAQIFSGNKLASVLLTESLPTPAISYLSKRLNGLGVIVTASHNPAGYNGVKIKLDGRAAPERVTTAVESFLGRSQPSRGTDFRQKSYRDTYLQYLRSRVNTAKIMSSLKKSVVVDYMHGAGAGFMEELLPTKRLITLHGEHDPMFGGINPEPIESNLKSLVECVRREKALIGIALDGDADRIGIIDDLGNYFTPCQVFPMLIRYLLDCKKIKGKIVQSVSLGYISARIARAEKLEFEELPVGFKHVAEQVAAGTAVIAGEESGGYAWKGGIAERDGLLTALVLLEMCTTLGKTPSQLWKEISTQYGASFFKRVDYKLNKPIVDKVAFAAKLTKRLPKKILGSELKQLLTIDGLKIILAEDHWLLMRPSGTEPLMRVYAESDSATRTTELLELAKKWVSPGS